MAARNDSIQGDFRRIDAIRFTASIYRNGSSASRCSVFIGDDTFINGIAYSESENFRSNSFNELLTVEADELSMFLKPMGMAAGRSERAKLTQEGAAELYWELLIQRLQTRKLTLLTIIVCVPGPRVLWQS